METRAGKTNDNKAPQGGEKPNIVQALCALAYATEVGPDPAALAERSGFPQPAMEEITARMRAAGLWTSCTVDQSEWWNASGEFVAQQFFAQAKVAIGEACRLKTDVGYEYRPIDPESDGLANQLEERL